ncbi:MAG: GNAT family N-acetyltransferase [Flavobacterium sp.]
MISFKNLQIKDITIIQNLAHEIWNKSYLSIISQEQIDYMLNEMYSDDKIKENISKNHYWKIILFNEKPIGFTHFYPIDSIMFLSKIYILHEFQRKNIGKETIALIQKTSIELNLNKIQLRVNKKNNQAMNAYLKNNFKIVKEDILHLTDKYIMDDYIMELSLI